MEQFDNVVLVGNAGSGKPTLLNTLLGTPLFPLHSDQSPVSPKSAPATTTPTSTSPPSSPPPEHVSMVWPDKHLILTDTPALSPALSVDLNMAEIRRALTRVDKLKLVFVVPMMRSLLPSDADVAAISAVLYPFVEAGVDMSDRYGVILNQLSSRFQTPDMQAKIKASFFDRFAVALTGDDATSGGGTGGTGNKDGSIRSGGTGGVIPKTSHFLCIGKEKSSRHKEKQKQKEKAKELEKAKQLEKEKEKDEASKQQQDKPQEKDLLGNDVGTTTTTAADKKPEDADKPDAGDSAKQGAQPSSSSAASPPTPPPPLIDLTSTASLATPSNPPPIGSPLVPTTVAPSTTTTSTTAITPSSPTPAASSSTTPTTTTAAPVLVPTTPTPPTASASSSSTTRDALWEFAVHRFEAVSLGDAVRQHLDVRADLFHSELARLQTGGKLLSTMPPRPPTPPPNSGSVGGGDTGGAGDVPEPPAVNGEGIGGDAPAVGGKHRWRDRVRPSAGGGAKIGTPTFPGQTAQPRQQMDDDDSAGGASGGEGIGRQRAMSMDGRPSTAAGGTAAGKTRGRKWPPTVRWASWSGSSGGNNNGAHVSFSPDTGGAGEGGVDAGTKKTARSRWSISGIVGPRGVDPPSGVSGGAGSGRGAGGSRSGAAAGAGRGARESKWKKMRLPTIKVQLPKIPFFRGKDNPSGIRQQAL